MPLLYTTITLVVLSFIALITGKILKKNIIFYSGVTILTLVIVFWIGFCAWALDEESREQESAMQEQSNNVNLSTLSNYFGNKISYEDGIKLLNKIKNEYKKYLVNSNGNGDSKGLYMYFSKDAENSVDEITRNAIIGMIDDYINTRKSDNTGIFNITTGIDEKNGQYIYILKEEKTNLSGSIIDVKDDYIVVRETEKEQEYKVNANIITKKFQNYRTTEDINISDVKIGDYYIDGKIIRNISGEELKKECIKNLAFCYEQGDLICNPKEITNVQNMGNYVIISVIMEDSTSKYFNKENADTFELKAKASADLKIPTHSNDVTVFNLKEKVVGFMYWIGLDKNTINDKYPTIIDIEIYDG